jgi:hypothetical protein
MPGAANPHVHRSTRAEGRPFANRSPLKALPNDWFGLARSAIKRDHTEVTEPN